MANNHRPKTRNADDERPAIWVGYGKLTKLFRERARLNQQQLAEKVGYSLEQVASIEQGRRPAKESFTDAAERVLKAGGVLKALQDDVDLARLPRFFQNFAAMEADALSRFSYDPLLVPGLLQTEDYARTLLNAYFPPLDDEVVDDRVTGRLARQSLLTRKNPLMVFVFILEEAALYRQVGGPEVMRAQLEKLLEQGRLRNVEIQVMPSRRAAHSGLSGQFTLLETKDRRKFAAIGAHGVMNVRSAPDEVSALWLQYGMLRTQALNSEESASLIERVAGEL